MKLSNKGRYGVRALFDIAFHNDGKPTQIREIAGRQAIPVRFLEQIFQELKKAGIVGAKRGPRGGYHLARAASEITIGDIFRALEGPIVVCPENDDEEGERIPSSPDASNAIFRQLASNVEKCFDELSIANVCAQGDALGIRRGTRERVTYVI